MGQATNTGAEVDTQDTTDDREWDDPVSLAEIGECENGEGSEERARDGDRDAEVRVVAGPTAGSAMLLVGAIGFFIAIVFVVLGREIPLFFGGLTAAWICLGCALKAVGVRVT